jgi:hypothetical protein
MYCIQDSQKSTYIHSFPNPYSRACLSQRSDLEYSTLMARGPVAPRVRVVEHLLSARHILKNPTVQFFVLVDRIWWINVGCAFIATGSLVTLWVWQFDFEDSGEKAHFEVVGVGYGGGDAVF